MTGGRRGFSGVAGWLLGRRGDMVAAAEPVAAASGPVAAVEPVRLRDTANYRVTYYERSRASLVIVFISAGRSAPGEPVEEFKRTLERFDTSIIFVLDRNARWFNYDESTEMWAELDAVAREYPQVAAVGESMGGCGAILATRELSRVDRVLALSPQHSILKPFVDFDSRYEGVSRQIGSHRYIHFSDSPDPAKCVLLFGNAEWRDYMHSVMFIGHAFAPLYIEGSNHNVAAFLKALPGNGLVRLVGALLDWGVPFTRAGVAALFPGVASEVGMRPGASFASEATGHNHTLMAHLGAAFARASGTTLGPNLALGCPATQSSLSSWSLGRTLAEDAGGAVSGVITGSYSFHTENEAAPWWSVDLGRACAIQEIRVFNYMAAEPVMLRTALLRLLVSDDGATWAPVYQRDEATAFGGSDGLPLVWRPAVRMCARHVRVQAAGPTYLHLDQVQVFGHPVV